MTNEVRGILVEFFRDATNGDYLEALNKAESEILELIKAKIFLQPDVSGSEANQPENKKDGEVAVAFAEWIFNRDYGTTKSIQELYKIYKNEKVKATDR